MTDPFPHVISKEILPPDLYRRLRADYPTSDEFDATGAETGSAGSRTGKGTGYDIYRGDRAYDALIKASAAWSEFDAFVNSDAFIRQYQSIFGAFDEDLGLTVDVEGSTYDRGYVEPRAVLTAKATLSEKLNRVSHRLTRGLQKKRKIELFTRLDIQRSLGGYAKPPHTDRANRLCSLIIYFTDAEQVGLQGGELLIYKHKESKAQPDYERHPKAANVDIVARLKPKENLGVLFPCNNSSYHGVTAVTSKGVSRDFLYINISGRASNLW